MRTHGTRLARSLGAVFAVSALTLGLATQANALQQTPDSTLTSAPISSVAPAPAPSPVAVPPMPHVAALPFPSVTPVPAPIVPNAQGHIICPEGVVCLSYQHGIPAQVPCAVQFICTILLPNETIDPNGITGVQSGAGTLPGESQQRGLWSVIPSTRDGDSMLTIAPYADSPFTNITVRTDARIYNIDLVPNPHARGVVYKYLYADRNNVVIVPQEGPRVYETPTPEPAGEELAPAPCPKSYAVKPQNSPPFWPRSVWIHDDTVTVSFDASTTLPSVGLPMQGEAFPVDLNHLGLVAPAYDAVGAQRNITVLNCYASIVFYTSDGHGRHAVVLEASP